MVMDQAKVEFHAGHKLGWIEAIASDPAMTGVTLKVAVAISQRAGRDGVARTASQVGIARHLRITDRAVRTCIARLRRGGYLEQLTPGGRTVDGRGRAAEYRLVKPQRLSQAAKMSGQRNMASGNRASENAEPTFQNPGSRLPPLPSTSHNNFLTHAQTHSSDPPAQGEPDCPWPAIKVLLAQQASFGPDKVAAWLDALQVRGWSDGILSLISCSKLRARYVAQNFERLILDAWRKIDPNARRVIVEYGAAILPLQQEHDDLVRF
jgi:hypothetical protein